MTAGEPRNRIDEALLLSQSSYCSDMIVGLVMAGSTDPVDAPINPMLRTFMSKYALVVLEAIKERHGSRIPLTPLIGLMSLCLAAKKCNEAGATLPLTNVEENEPESAIVKNLCDLDPLTASLALPFWDTMNRSKLLNMRSGAVLRRLVHISQWVMSTNSMLFKDTTLLPGDTQFPAQFLPVRDSNICVLLDNSGISHALSNEIMSISRSTIKLLASYYATITGKLPDSDIVGPYVLLKVASTEIEIYSTLASIRTVEVFKRKVYGIPYTKAHIAVSPEALLDRVKRAFRPNVVDYTIEYCAYMHRNGMLKYPMLNTLPEGWYKSTAGGTNLHSTLWYSMAVFVATVYSDYKPLLVWLNKYQYKKVQKDWNMDVMRAKFRAAEVLGLGIDIKQQKVGKGVLYNFLKEGMVGVLANRV